MAQSTAAQGVQGRRPTLPLVAPRPVPTEPVQTEQSISRATPADQSHAAYIVTRVQEALAGLRYGEVRVVVQDGVVVQVERTEKVRL